LKNIHTPEQANAFLNDHYIGEFNRRFMVEAAESGTAFAPIQRQDLDRVFAIQQERVVDNDNTIQFANHVWQIPPTPFRATLAGCRVIVYEHLDGTFSVGYGPHTVARFTAAGDPVPPPRVATSRRKLSKTGHGQSRARGRTWPINNPEAKNFPRQGLVQRQGTKVGRPRRQDGWERQLPLRPKTLRPTGSAGAPLQLTPPPILRKKRRKNANAKHERIN
jgi:hypothetical protein